MPNVKRLDLSGLAGLSPAPNDPAGRRPELSIAGGMSNDAVVDLIIRVSDDGNAHLPMSGRALAGFALGDAERAIAMACIERWALPATRGRHAQAPTQNRITVVGRRRNPESLNCPAVKAIP